MIMFSRNSARSRKGAGRLAPRNDVSPHQIAGRRCTAFSVEVGLLPSFTSHWSNRLQSLCRKSFASGLEILGNESIELVDNVLPFATQRINTGEIVISGSTLIENHRAIDLRCFLPDTLFTGDRSSFFSGHYFLTNVISFVG